MISVYYSIYPFGLDDILQKIIAISYDISQLVSVGKYINIGNHFESNEREVCYAKLCNNFDSFSWNKLVYVWLRHTGKRLS